MISRILSALIGIGYIAFAFFSVGVEAVFMVGIFLALPLGCIWFSDDLGEYTGVVSGGAISATTPGWLVAIGGWVLLLLPLAVETILYLRGGR